MDADIASIASVGSMLTTAVLAVTVCAALLEDEADDRSACPPDADAINQLVSDEIDDLTGRKKRQHHEDDDDDGLPQKKRYVRYNRERAYACVQEDYLGPTPKFNDYQFERFFRITRTLFDGLTKELASYDEYWTVRYDCTHRRSIMPVVKCLAALKLLCYGVSFSAFQDYFQMGDSTARECCGKFSRAMVENENIAAVYLRKMTKADARRIEALHYEAHGVRGMLGSLDVKQIPWGNCPTEQKGQHEGKSNEPTLGLEAAVDYNLWFWHWCFGWPGSMNDVNIWEKSTLLNSFTDGSFYELDFPFEIDGQVFTMLYFLVDGIYPHLARFLQTVSVPLTRIDRNFAGWQEGSRKDVERGYGVWVKKFLCMKHPIELFEVEDIYYVVGATICLHNMMVEVRVSRDETESDAFYNTVSASDPQHKKETSHVDPAPQAVAEEEAYLKSNAGLLDGRDGVIDLDLVEKAQQARSLPLRLRYAEWRWDQLTNTREHVRLQNAVKNQKWRDDYGNADGNVLDRHFNPRELLKK